MKRVAQKVAIFLHSGEYDRMHQGLSIAAAAAAADRPVDLFLFWWALDRLLTDRLDEPDFPPAHAEAADRFETRNLPTLRQLLEHARATGKVTVYACTGSLQAVAASPQGVQGRVDQLVGWSTILQLTAGVVDRYYL